MSQTARIVVVGSSNIDMTIRAARLPLPGETVAGGLFSLSPGGKGANQAVAAARLGAEVAFIGRVGADEFGKAALRSLEADGVDTQFCLIDPDFFTGVALISVDYNTGENSILVASGANGAFSPADIDRAAALIEGGAVVVCQMEVRQDVVIAVLERAYRAGVTTVLNPAPAQPLPDYAWEYVSVLTPNQTEMEQLGGDPQTLLRKGVGAVVTTCGAEGAWVVTEAGEVAIKGITVQHVADTTAAGDCFTGALAVALGEGMPLSEAAHFANAAAALSVTKPGAQMAMPTRAAVDDFLSADLG